MNRPEQIIQRAVFDHFAARAARGVFAFHCPNGGWRSRIEAAILKGCGVRPGIPDVFAIKQGQAYGLELKAPGGELSGDQETALADLAAAGAVVAVADSLDAAIRQLETWGLLRGQAALASTDTRSRIAARRAR